METIDIAATRTLLGVWAHPDDEAYLTAGLMLRVARSGGRAVCVTATRGELGTDDPERWPPAVLAEHRERELRSALAHVGVGDVRFLGVPDGECDEIPPEVGAAAIEGVIDEIEPDVIVTFGPDGITGHPDHVAVSRWTTEAWSRRARGSALLYATMTPAFVRRNARLHRRVGVFPDGYPRPSTPDDRVHEIVLGRDELARKRAVLAAHASQTDALARLMGESAFTNWMATESFRHPRPAELRALGPVTVT
jgi:LmbE family N-acetylglucosaminyl deacetylase